MSLKNKMTLSRRTSKAIVASALGLTLLLGGSTYALWSATDTANTSATVSTGDLKVTAASVQSWSDITEPASPVAIDLASYKLTPGDTIQLKQDLNVIVVGDNISGILEVHVPNNTLSAPLMAQAQFSLSLLNKSGLEIGSLTAATNTSGSLALTTPNLAPTAAAGELYTVKLSVTLPKASDNATQIQVASLGDMSITLTQGPKLAAEDLVPPVIQTPVLAAAKVGSTYEQPLTVTGHPIVSIDSGALPGGMALNKTAYKIAGVPTETGTFDFSVKAVNPTGATSKAYQMVVAPPVNDYGIPVGTVVYASAPFTSTSMVSAGNPRGWMFQVSTTSGALYFNGIYNDASWIISTSSTFNPGVYSVSVTTNVLPGSLNVGADVYAKGTLLSPRNSSNHSGTVTLTTASTIPIQIASISSMYTTSDFYIYSIKITKVASV